MSDSEKAVEKEPKTAEKASKVTEETEGKLKRAREETDNSTSEEKTTEKLEDEEIAKKKLRSLPKDKSAEKTEEKASEKPKHIFGSATSFGSGFAAAKKSTGSNDSKDDNSKPKPSAFGSGLSFGGGFTMLKKTDEKTPKTAEREKNDIQVDSKEETPSSEDKRDQITESETTAGSSESNGFRLHKQEVISGEESEEVLYQVNAKLYQLTDLKLGWKERGVGFIKVNKNKTTDKARLVMRSRGILKVILNLPLVKGFKIQRGFPGSLQSEKFLRITAVDDNKAPLQYALKTGKEETARELYDHVVKLVPE